VFKDLFDRVVIDGRKLSSRTNVLILSNVKKVHTKVIKAMVQYGGKRTIYIETWGDKET
jgi:hypothetical protein